MAELGGEVLNDGAHLFVTAFGEHFDLSAEFCDLFPKSLDFALVFKNNCWGGIRVISPAGLALPVNTVFGDAPRLQTTVNTGKIGALNSRDAIYLSHPLVNTLVFGWMVWAVERGIGCSLLL